MTTHHLVATAFAMGHILAMIYVVNVSHGLGVNVRWLDRAVYGAVAVCGLWGLAATGLVWGRPWQDWPVLVRVYSTVCLALVCFALPIITLGRIVRRPITGCRMIAESSRDFRLEEPEAVGNDPSIRSKMLRWRRNESLTLSQVEWTVEIEGLPPALDGLSILHLTDLHFASCYPRRYFEWVVEAVASGPSPDLLMITGDFVDDDAAIDWVSPILGQLSARLASFAILGNHDYLHNHRQLRRSLRCAGLQTLEGRWATFEANGLTIAVGGTTSPWGKDLLTRTPPYSDFQIVMSHSPDEFPRLAKTATSVVLSGHNHGGQVRLPIFGPVLMPSRYSRRFDRGFFRLGASTMFVGQGVGAKDPLRINCPPQIARLILRVPGDKSRPSPDNRGKNLDGRVVDETITPEMLVSSPE